MDKSRELCFNRGLESSSDKGVATGSDPSRGHCLHDQIDAS